MYIENFNKKEIREYLSEGKRIDKRGVFDFREIVIESGVSKNAEGSARVRIGKTEVIAGVKMGVSEPYPDHDDEGTLIVNVELLPLSSPRFEYGPPRIEAIEIARVIDRGIRESGMIDFKKLCIKKGEKVWGVFIDLAVINDDGNLLDAGNLAAITAIKLAKMPVYDEKEEKVKFGDFTKKSLPLSEKIPLSLTFYKVGKTIILDPTREEEDSSDGRITFAVSGKKEGIIHAIQKGGGISFETNEIESILKELEKTSKDYSSKILKELEVK